LIYLIKSLNLLPSIISHSSCIDTRESERYLARDYFFSSSFKKCLDTLKKKEEPLFDISLFLFSPSIYSIRSTVQKKRKKKRKKTRIMDPSTKSAANLFQVYLRLRPPPGGASTSVVSGGSERFLDVEEPDNDDGDDDGPPTHITLNPPNDRRRAIEKFAFTQVFEEDASQLDVFHCTGVASLVEGVLAPHGGLGTDGLLATLGVTGSGKVGFFFFSFCFTSPVPEGIRGSNRNVKRGRERGVLMRNV
jgi:hypothetical protein